MRRERRREAERELRQSHMGTERKAQMMAREQNRDFSEKVALGLARPTKNQDSMYDSRLFNQSSGFDSGFNEDQAYDKPLFAAQDAINSIYRPKTNVDDDDDGGDAVDAIQKSKRFEVLGAAKEGFKGAAEAEVCIDKAFAQMDLLTDFDRQGTAQFSSKRTLATLSTLVK